MTKGTRICKICGIEYPYCKTIYEEGVFRYQDVACCIEHGTEYLAKVLESRDEVKPEKPAVTSQNKTTKSKPKRTTKKPANNTGK